MQIFLSLAFLSFYLVGSALPSPPARDVFTAPLILLLAVLAVPSLLLVRALQRKSRDGGATSEPRRRSRLLDDRYVMVLWLISSLVGITWGQWGATVRELARTTYWQPVEFPLLLLPGLVGLLGAWCGQALLCRAETPNESRRAWQCVREFVRLRVHVYLTLALLPLLAVATFQWLAQPLDRLLSSSWSAAVLSLFVLLASLAVLPDAVATAWQTRKFTAGAVRQLLVDSAAAMQVRFNDIRIWPTGGRVSNALVLGSIFPRKLLVLSDGLVDLLSAPQLAMVVAHEAAHVRCRHLRQRTLLLAAPLVTLAAAVVLRGESSSALATALADIERANSWLVMATVGCAYATYVYAVVGWFSRRVETEADLRACGRRGKTSNSYQIDRAAVANYSAALLRLAEHSGQDPFRASWLHPSLGDRILFLNRVSNCPGIGGEFLNGLQSYRRLLGVTWLAALGLLLAF